MKEDSKERDGALKDERIAVPAAAPTKKPYDILAAGGVVWRGGQEHPALGNLSQDPLELLLVHRPKYDDWSFPKGKIEPGELFVTCAVREIAEETGLQVCLGPKLAVTDYLVDGKDKQVTYWLAKVRNSPAVLARPYAEPASEAEIDEKRWVTIDEAPNLLTHEFDQSLARRAAEALREGWGQSRPLLLVRHGKSKKREKWHTDDALRPLKKRGKRQANELVSVLSAFGVSRVASSAWKRCEQTVKPYLKATAIDGEFVDSLSETGFALNPAQTMHLMESLAEESLVRGGTAICSHRPVLAPLMEQLALHSADTFPEDLWRPLGLGETLVAHLVNKDEQPQIVAVERYLPEAPQLG